MPVGDTSTAIQIQQRKYSVKWKYSSLSYCKRSQGQKKQNCPITQKAFGPSCCLLEDKQMIKPLFSEPKFLYRITHGISLNCSIWK